MRASNFQSANNYAQIKLHYYFKVFKALVGYWLNHDSEKVVQYPAILEADAKNIGTLRQGNVNQTTEEGRKKEANKN